MAFSDARNEKSRAETGKNAGNHGGGNARDAERRNREAMAKGGGAKASGMSSVAADHAIATGRIGAPSIPAGGVARGNYATQDDAYNDYSRAVGAYDQRGFMDKALDFLGGGFYDLKEPMAGNPRSFAGGSFHSTTNPGGVLGGLAGMLAPGAGLLAGPAFSGAYNSLGLPEVWHGGLTQPDLRTGVAGNTTNPMGGSFADIGGGWFGQGHTYASGANPSSVNTASGFGGQGGPMGGGTGNYSGGQIAQNGPMSPAAPMQAAQAPSAPAAPAYGGGLMQGGGGYLGVPGGKPYGLMTPGYQWSGR